jgi:SAM-dependent methyltransferase
MNPNQALWKKGDFTRIAEGMRASGEALVDAIGIAPGQRVLDLGCGDGTTAIPAARAGADVLGVDIAANLVEAGRRRAAAEGLGNIRFEQGDATNLDGLADDQFDRVVTIFGAMFAPRPDDVAREMVRVTRPGGQIVMGNWIPGDPTLVAQILRISSAYSPPPPEGFVSPMLWGVEDQVVERFAAAGVPADHLAFARETFRFDFDGPPGQAVDRFRRFYGPTMNAFEAAEQAGRADELRGELEQLFERENEAEGDRTRIGATYLRVTATVP